MNSKFSRRSLMQGAGALAGVAAASKLTGASGLITSTAHAQVAAEKPALLVVYLNGGYNALFPSADSFLGVSGNNFGVTGANMVKDLGNGLMVDAQTYGTLPTYALQHMASVGVRHGLTAHGAAQAANFTVMNRSSLLMLASAMGGDAAIKAVQSGNQGLPGPKTPEGGVSLQTITDMKSTIAALGGASDPTIPDRTIAAAGLEAAQTMSDARLKPSPLMLASAKEGYAAGIDTLKKPVQMFNYNAMAQAYALPQNNGVYATAVNNFTAQIACAELMITAGANVVAVSNGGWDTHGDSNGQTVRNKMNQTILPALKVFINRMMNLPDRNVAVVIYGDFARSLPGSDHASALTATVIGKYVKVGTTGKVNANVTLPAGSPAVPGLYAYLASILKTPGQPFGANPHPTITL
ncbi:MAG: DUF1501 domain-containing protein [Myxococcaceae bacterium]|nr:DUF1501 domain-containing protein [Myxococcaceae bacterium]